MSPKCHQMSPNVTRCHESVTECHGVSRSVTEVSQCHKMSPSCHQLSPKCHQNVTECHGMSQNVTNCHNMSPNFYRNVTICLHLSHSCHCLSLQITEHHGHCRRDIDLLGWLGVYGKEGGVGPWILVCAERGGCWKLVVWELQEGGSRPPSWIMELSDWRHEVHGGGCFNMTRV